MMSSSYLYIMKGHAISQPPDFGLYGQVPLDVVNKASTAMAELALILQKVLAIHQRLSEIAADLREGLQIPFVIFR